MGHNQKVNARMGIRTHADEQGRFLLLTVFCFHHKITAAIPGNILAVWKMGTALQNGVLFSPLFFRRAQSFASRA
jgi:hypothetical protein